MPASGNLARLLLGTLVASTWCMAQAPDGPPPQTGFWQPGGEFPLPNEDKTPTSRFLLLDTGGSGGMFGQGDLRSDLRDVAFWDDGRSGVASSHAGVFITADGGLTWRRIRQHTRVAYPDEKGIQYHHIELAGPGDIWLAETKHPAIARHLWHSTDAGATWDDATQRLPGPLESVWDLLARGRHIWVLGGWKPRSSFRSDDGGHTWRPLALPKGFEPYTAATPANAPADALRTVYLLGAERRQGARLPRLLRSDDGGNRWRDIPLPDPVALPWAFSHASIAFATADDGMVGLQAPGFAFRGHGRWEKDPGASAAVLVTANGGKTWRHRELPGEELFLTALWQDPADPDHAFAGVWNGFVAQRGMPRNGPALYETVDAGDTWAIALRGALQINAIVGVPTGKLWAVGDRVGFAANDVVAILAPPSQHR